MLSIINPWFNSSIDGKINTRPITIVINSLVLAAVQASSVAQCITSLFTNVLNCYAYDDHVDKSTTTDICMDKLFLPKNESIKSSQDLTNALETGEIIDMS